MFPSRNLSGEDSLKLIWVSDARRIYSLKARIGNHAFSVTTGVPQGGILSPWLFVMAMNDLSLRLGGAGGSVVSGQELGTLLYADDILLADDDVAYPETRCHLTKDCVE
jgi:hypothetical protein